MGLAAATAVEAADGPKPAHFRVRPDSENGCYPVGGKAIVEIAIEEEGRRPEGPVEAWVDDGWTNVLWKRTVDMSTEPTFKMELTRTTPGSLRIHLKAKGMAERLDRVIFGVDDIKPLTPCPDDFEAYWKGERERLEREVPLAMEKTPAPHLDTADYHAFYVSVATFDGGRVHAILTVPKGDGVFPVCATVPGAGPGQVAPWNLMARKGWISITMHIHGFPIAKTADEQKARYNTWLAALKKKSGEPTYQRFGFAMGRDLPIYHYSILGMVRMLDWLAQEPYADASRFVYFGGSQGGGYGLYLTSMWGRFAKSVVYFPNMCQRAYHGPDGRAQASRRTDWPVLRRLQFRAAHPHAHPHHAWTGRRQLPHRRRNRRLQFNPVEGQEASAHPRPRPSLDQDGIRAVAV